MKHKIVHNLNLLQTKLKKPRKNAKLEQELSLKSSNNIKINQKNSS